MEVKFQVSQKSRNSVTSWVTISFSERHYYEVLISKYLSWILRQMRLKVSDIQEVFWLVFMNPVPLEIQWKWEDK
jgi:hypothetical protein